MVTVKRRDSGDIHSKVGGASLGALLATILLWVLNAYGGVHPPPEVASAVTGVLAFAGGYLTHEGMLEPKRTEPDHEHVSGNGQRVAVAAS